jgi:hypothetical protein
MQWKYNGNLVEEIADQYIGFVYIITNLTNNKKYIGKKLAKFKKTRPPLKGKKRKRKSLVESDWQTYWGSSEHLLADVAELGTENFSREILYFCTTRGELSYREAKEQFDREVLLTDEYYNGIINVRIGGSQALKESLKNNIPPL